MEEFLKEILSFQSEIGVNSSFDFITGRDFFKKKDNISGDQKDNVLAIKSAIDDTLTKENNANDEKDVNCFIDNYEISNIKIFSEIVEKIKNFNGCDLKRYSMNTVIFDGNENAKIMLIGEAPGENEDLQGKPFCGQSGQLLRQALEYINLNMSNLFITNTVYWRPPQNRKPTEQEIAICRPFLIKMIEIIDPEIIILCGATAIESMLKCNAKMSEITGKFQTIKIDMFNSKVKNVHVFPIYHPSFLLRQPSMKKTFWQHLLILQDELIKKGIYAV